MNSPQWLRLLLRRWYVVLLGLLLTGLGAQMALHAARPVYWTKVTVVVLIPPTIGTANPLQLASDATAIAGVVVADHAAHHPTLVTGPQPAQPAATLYGQGVRDGSRVTVRNIGGQWTTQFPLPRIDIEVVGPSAAEVTARVHRITAELSADLDRWQSRFDVGQEYRLTLEPTMGSVGVREVTGRPTRLLVAVGMLGLLGTALLVRTVEHVSRRLLAPPGRGWRRVSRWWRRVAGPAGGPRRSLLHPRSGRVGLP